MDHHTIAIISITGSCLDFFLGQPGSNINDV